MASRSRCGGGHVSEQPRQDQKTNSQAQAGAASQIILNLIFMTHDGTSWVVQPVVMANRDSSSGDTAQPGALSTSGAESEGPATGVEVESQKKSNAQGQGLTVHNGAHIANELLEAMNVATEQWLKNRPNTSDDPS